MRRWNGLIEEYKEWLPVTDKTPELDIAGRKYAAHPFEKPIRTMGRQPIRQNGRDKPDRLFQGSRHGNGRR